MRYILGLVALFFITCITGCRGTNAASAKDVQGNVHQQVIDQSKTTNQMNLFVPLPPAARDFIKALSKSSPALPATGFNSDLVVVLVNGQPISSAYPHTEIPAVGPKDIEVQFTIGILNGNQGEGSTMRHTIVHFTIRGVELVYNNSLQVEPGRNSRAWGDWPALHPTDLDDDDPPIASGNIVVKFPPPGRYEGSVTIQSEDKNQITRRFTLVVKE